MSSSHWGGGTPPVRAGESGAGSDLTAGRLVGLNIVAAVVVFATAAIALALKLPPSVTPAIWPPAGVALAFTLLYGARVLPGVFGVALLLGLGLRLGDPEPGPLLAMFAVAFTLASATVAGPIAGAAVVRRWTAGTIEFTSVRDILILILAAGPVAGLTGSSLEATALHLGGALSSEAFVEAWSSAWLAHVFGVAIFAPLVLAWFGGHRAGWKQRRPALTGALCTVLALVILLMVYVRNEERSRIRNDFDGRAQAWVEEVAHRFADVVDSTESIVNWLRVGGDPSVPTLQQFVATDLARRPELRSLSWNPFVAAGSRAEYEASPGLEIARRPIRERTLSGGFLPAGSRPWYVPVRAIAPLASNRAALGYDVASEPRRREALLRAWERGEPSMTAPLGLVQAADEIHVLVFVPAFEAPLRIAESEPGRRALAGFAVAVAHVEKLIAPDRRLAGDLLSLKVTDLTSPDEPTALAGALSASSEADEAASLAARRWAATGRIDELVWTETRAFGGRLWRFELRPKERYVVQMATVASNTLVAVALGGTSLLAVLLMMLTGQSLQQAGRAEELAAANRALADEALERARVAVALQEERDRAEVTLHSIGDAVIRTGPHGKVEYVNPVAEQLTGLSASDAVGRDLSEVFVVLADSGSVNIRADGGFDGLDERRSRPSSRDVAIADAAGHRHVVHASSSVILDDADEPKGYVLAFQDVTEQRRMAREVEYQARHDMLTGLVNRREFERLAAAALREARLGSRGALAFLDLDQFKVVNDTAGHVAGDELLRLVAATLSRQLREGDTLARLGGDEFGLLLSGCDLDEAQLTARRLVDAVRAIEFDWAGRSFQIGVSVGLVRLSIEVADVTELLSQADVACYAAKELGRGQVRCYEAKAGPDVGVRLRHDELFRAADLRAAMGEGRLELFGQRIVPLAAADLGGDRYEVLLRLRGEDGELVEPGRFIPAAERYGLMPAIDAWVVEQSLEIASRASGRARLSINLSGTTLGDPASIESITRQVRAAGMSPGSLSFEITETAAIGNLTRALAFMAEMKDLGCLFALDDFGTGLSSFGYLKDLPVDYLKIDGSFVQGMEDDAQKTTMVGAINDLAHALGVETIAEWVESAATLEGLRALGVDYAQGFAMSKPKPLLGQLLAGAGGRLKLVSA